jgi:hypothetical protein
MRHEWDYQDAEATEPIRVCAVDVAAEGEPPTPVIEVAPDLSDLIESGELLDACAAEILRLAEALGIAEHCHEASSEIIAEMSAALAVLAGEALKPCAHGRPGHLGARASAAVDASLKAWQALLEGNRAAVERIAELDARNERQYLRLAGIDALLANEAPPEGLISAVVCRAWVGPATAAWQWFREQFTARESGLSQGGSSMSDETPETTVQEPQAPETVAQEAGAPAEPETATHAATDDCA